MSPPHHFQHWIFNGIVFFFSNLCSTPHSAPAQPFNITSKNNTQIGAAWGHCKAVLFFLPSKTNWHFICLYSGNSSGLCPSSVHNRRALPLLKARFRLPRIRAFLLTDFVPDHIKPAQEHVAAAALLLPDRVWWQGAAFFYSTIFSMSSMICSPLFQKPASSRSTPNGSTSS